MFRKLQIHTVLLCSETSNKGPKAAFNIHHFRQFIDLNDTQIYYEREGAYYVKSYDKCTGTYIQDFAG